MAADIKKNKTNIIIKIREANIPNQQKKTIINKLKNVGVQDFKKTMNFLNPTLKKLGVNNLVIPVLALGLGYGAVNPQELQAKEFENTSAYIQLNIPIGKSPIEYGVGISQSKNDFELVDNKIQYKGSKILKVGATTDDFKNYDLETSLQKTSGDYDSKRKKTKGLEALDFEIGYNTDKGGLVEIGKSGVGIQTNYDGKNFTTSLGLTADGSIKKTAETENNCMEVPVYDFTGNPITYDTTCKKTFK